MIEIDAERDPLHPLGTVWLEIVHHEPRRDDRDFELLVQPAHVAPRGVVRTPPEPAGVRSGEGADARGKLLWKNPTSGTRRRRAARFVIHGTRNGLPTSITLGRSCSMMRRMERVASMNRYGRWVGIRGPRSR